MLILEIIDTVLLVFLLAFFLRLLVLIPQLELKINDVVNAKIKELWDHRDDFKKPIEEFVSEIAKDMTGSAKQGGGMQPNMGSLMMGNMEIPLSLIPRKYQGLAALAMGFLGKKGPPGGGNTGGNPLE